MSITKGIYVGERYKIERPLSHIGGTASVYLGSLLEAEDFKVAIKFALTGKEGPQHEDLLLQKEAELLSKTEWRHPSIVRVYPLLVGKKSAYSLRANNIENQPWYMVMEYLQGGSLTDNKNKVKQMPLEWKLEMFYQILTAVGFIHEKGYAHRDLKPENIMFRKPIAANEIPQPILIDFALASDGQSGSQLVESSYTLFYAPPEKIMNSMGTGEAIQTDQFAKEGDIWSLGVILYEILVGDLPLKGSRENIRTSIISRGLDDILEKTDFGKKISSKRSDYSEKIPILTEYIRGMLYRDPTRRPTIDLLIKALENKFLPPRISIN